MQFLRVLCEISQFPVSPPAAQTNVDSLHWHTLSASRRPTQNTETCDWIESSNVYLCLYRPTQHSSPLLRGRFSMFWESILFWADAQNKLLFCTQISWINSTFLTYMSVRCGPLLSNPDKWQCKWAFCPFCWASTNEIRARYSKKAFCWLKWWGETVLELLLASSVNKNILLTWS